MTALLTKDNRILVCGMRNWFSPHELPCSDSVTFKQVLAGGDFIAALTTEGQLYYWGYIGTVKNKEEKDTYLKIANLEKSGINGKILRIWGK